MLGELQLLEFVSFPPINLFGGGAGQQIGQARIFRLIELTVGHYHMSIELKGDRGIEVVLFPGACSDGIKIRTDLKLLGF